MQAWVEGKTQTGGEAVRISLQLSVGGAAWGLAVGLAATLWLRFMFDNTHAEITLTVRLHLCSQRPMYAWPVTHLPQQYGQHVARRGSQSLSAASQQSSVTPAPAIILQICVPVSKIVAAYGAYIVADELLNVSGLLAVVALGTWLAAKGQHRISSRVDGPLRAVWCAAAACTGGLSVQMLQLQTALGQCVSVSSAHQIVRQCTAVQMY